MFCAPTPNRRAAHVAATTAARYAIGGNSSTSVPASVQRQQSHRAALRSLPTSRASSNLPATTGRRTEHDLVTSGAGQKRPAMVNNDGLPAQRSRSRAIRRRPPSARTTAASSSAMRVNLRRVLPFDHHANQRLGTRGRNSTRPHRPTTCSASPTACCHARHRQRRDRVPRGVDVDERLRQLFHSSRAVRPAMVREPPSPQAPATPTRCRRRWYSDRGKGCVPILLRPIPNCAV